jgi:hypothetical protein
MSEYLAHAEAHAAWVAWRDGDLQTARRRADAARELWEAIWSAPYGTFQWMPTWPLIGLALTDRDIARAVEYVQELLEPTRQPMPENLREALETSLEAFEHEGQAAAHAELERAAALAVGEGYL